jgi:hypothetical protein
VRILEIDIETSPNLAHVWDLWQQNVALNQLLQSTEMLCFAAKWYRERPVMFFSGHRDSKATMIESAHKLLDQADAVIHYNGRRFDVPHLNREFVEVGMRPPSPFAQIDLYQVVKRRFKFPSNKLDYVSRTLGLKGKVKHEGHELWVKCMAGDARAWKNMERYNKQDVLLLEELYDVLLPWIPSHPSRVVVDGVEGCPACGSTQLTRQGFAYTGVSKYQRFRCSDCGKWSRGSKRIAAADIREVTA